MKTKSIKGMNTKQLVYMALLIALSFVGSMIKIQGSIALDAIPGFFAALYIGPVAGGIVAGVGHFITAFTSGFPQTLPLHLILMVGMGTAAYLFGKSFRKTNPIIACIIGILFNSIIMLGVLAPITKMIGLPLNGKAFFIALSLPLTIASTVNVVLAYLIYKLIGDKI